MQNKSLAALKAQHQLIKTTIQHYMRAQIDMVNGGVLAAGHWQYAHNMDEHNGIVQMLQ